MARQSDSSGRGALPGRLGDFLRATNPWWENRPGREIPGYRRWAYGALLRKLETGLAPIVVLRGPRQVGKTTIQEQVIDHLVREAGVDPGRVLRVQFDELPRLRGSQMPVIDIAWWYEREILGRTLNEAARDGKPAFIFLDEVQNLDDWAPQLKALVDHNTVHVAVTGSSVLRIEAGRESLAGRITTLEIGTLLLREIAGLRWDFGGGPALSLNGMEQLRDPEFWRGLNRTAAKDGDVLGRAYAAFSERGGYPVGHANPDVRWPEVADQLNENVVRRVLQHDLRLGERGRRRDPQLLEEVFRLACRYAGQAPDSTLLIDELKRALRANVGWRRISNYLQFLEGALLIRLIRPLELRLKRRRGSPKLCVADHGLRASWLAEVVPLDPEALDQAPHVADLAGHLAESIAGSFLSDIPNLDVHHFPERSGEPEVDFVLTLGELRIPLEVKYRRRIDPHRDTLGLRSFMERTVYNAPFGVLVTRDEEAEIPDPRIVPVSLRALLWSR